MKYLSIVSIAVVLALRETLAFSITPTKLKVHNKGHVPGNLSRVICAEDQRAHANESAGERTSQSIKAFSVITACVAFNSVILPVQAVDIAKGNQLFTGNCAGCHAGGMNFVKEQKTLKSEALMKYVGSQNGDDLKNWVMNSGQHQRNVYFKAPSGNGKLTESEFADVTAFISDQAIRNAW